MAVIIPRRSITTDLNKRKSALHKLRAIRGELIDMTCSF